MEEQRGNVDEKRVYLPGGLTSLHSKLAVGFLFHQVRSMLEGPQVLNSTQASAVPVWRSSIYPSMLGVVYDAFLTN